VTAVALELLHAYAPPRPVRLLGVRMAGFEHDEPPGEPEVEKAQLQLTVSD
jgi:DNA polymerase-4